MLHFWFPDVRVSAYVKSGSQPGEVVPGVNGHLFQAPSRARRVLHKGQHWHVISLNGAIRHAEEFSFLSQSTIYQFRDLGTIDKATLTGSFSLAQLACNSFLNAPSENS